MSKRQSQLIYNDDRTSADESQSHEGDVLYFSPLGVPILWVFAFGERNVWNPGDKVSDRGGAVGKRNPYEIQVEVALLRLEHAEDALKQSSPSLWPWLSAMPILRRKLYTRPKTGYIRIVAPWMLSLKEDQIERWRAATAFAENCVNLLVADRNMQAKRSLAELRPFAPFVPLGNPKDVKAFRAIKAYSDKPEPLKLALLTVGEAENPEPMEKAAERDVAQALSDYEEYIENMEHATTEIPAHQLPSTSTSPGLLDKLTGIFKKRG